MQYYTIFGQKIGSHILSLGTLTSVGVLSAWATSGGKEKKQQGPPINASSKDEEEFINNFLKEAEQEDKKAKA